VYRKNVLGGVCVLQGDFQAKQAKIPGNRPAKIEAIPYFAYGNRGLTALRVWIPESREKAVSENLASKAKPSASTCCPTDSPFAMNDQVPPINSDQPQQKRFSWYGPTHLGTEEWVQYNFAEPFLVSAVEVYWWDDAERAKGGCHTPKSWRLLYRDGDQWKPVDDASPYGIKIDQFNHVTFKPVSTQALRIEAQLRPNFSAGIVEWKVE
jgi:hypothetical protein